ncbi:hypothetical protein CSPX01_15653 [Colletotrichum filicis]|nr:hypothetical protein CSPX01_15653 [Colletotrichum filicis]
MNLDPMPTPYSSSSNQLLVTSSWPCEPLLRAVQSTPQQLSRLSSPFSRHCASRDLSWRLVNG